MANQGCLNMANSSKPIGRTHSNSWPFSDVSPSTFPSIALIKNDVESNFANQTLTDAPHSRKNSETSRDFVGNELDSHNNLSENPTVHVTDMGDGHPRDAPDQSHDLPDRGNSLLKPHPEFCDDQLKDYLEPSNFIAEKALRKELLLILLSAYCLASDWLSYVRKDSESRELENRQSSDAFPSAPLLNLKAPPTPTINPEFSSYLSLILVATCIMLAVNALLAARVCHRLEQIEDQQFKEYIVSIFS